MQQSDLNPQADKAYCFHRRIDLEFQRTIDNLTDNEADPEVIRHFGNLQIANCKTATDAICHIQRGLRYEVVAEFVGQGFAEFADHR